jgi:membrane protein YdbS with pleckstrin-like domain
MSLSKIISLVIKLVWLLTFVLVVTIDRDNNLMTILTITLLILISLTTIIRSINSRNEWREMIEDGEVEIKDKISFD